MYQDAHALIALNVQHGRRDGGHLSPSHWGCPQGITSLLKWLQPETAGPHKIACCVFAINLHPRSWLLLFVLPCDARPAVRPLLRLVKISIWRQNEHMAAKSLLDWQLNKGLLQLCTPPAPSLGPASSPRRLKIGCAVLPVEGWNLQNNQRVERLMLVYPASVE